MNPQYYFAIALALLAFLIIFFDKKYGMLRDEQTPTPAVPPPVNAIAGVPPVANAPLPPVARRPYSYSRVQLAWWIFIIGSAFIAVLCAKCVPPDFTSNPNILVLLGITSSTMVAAKVIDTSDITNKRRRQQDQPTGGFFQDILDDGNGTSVHRFQALIFNAATGVWLVIKVWNSLNMPDANAIIPVISSGVVTLLGISAAAYVVPKNLENK